ncbi:MAG: phosphotyrosine protein phosphatase [Sphingomonadaceae bacterium]|nr:phosphotyrosine protein phosphatase [Sphingomonadaceae bacterium]
MSIPVITRQFGTVRGAVRLALAYLETGAGFASVQRPGTRRVQRLVFVCHGNICRSAYAEALARRAGARTASFGLSTTTGKPAHEPVLRHADGRGVDLSAHRTTAVEDYRPAEGDLLLAMETRHLRRLAADGRLLRLPRVLLGSYALPQVPHLHDPYQLDERYMAVCLDRIERAVAALCGHYPDASISEDGA